MTRVDTQSFVQERHGLLALLRTPTLGHSAAALRLCRHRHRAADQRRGQVAACRRSKQRIPVLEAHEHQRSVGAGADR